MRKYNNNVDEYYSPDATPDLYLDDETVNSVLEQISRIETEEEIEVRTLIKKIETLHRNACLGGISLEASKQEIRKLSDSFLEKFGFWPYLTKTFTAFYKSFEK